jgi:hypothetical protein
MKSTLKVWTGLGVATALVGAGLAGCAGESGEGEGGEGAEVSQSGEAGEGESGEGESGSGDGEGGIDVSEAASDPVVYGSALAIVNAHAIAARDAYDAGKTDAAAEMFGHPVTEVLAEMEATFETLGVADFKDTMNAASAEALKPDNKDGVEKAFNAVQSALKNAAGKTPESGLSRGAIAAGIVADQIERATSMYGYAVKNDIYSPYLDGYGFYQSASNLFARDAGLIKTYNSGLHSDIEAALELLGTAYPGVERPATLDVAQGQLAGASSKIKLGLPAD